MAYYVSEDLLDTTEVKIHNEKCRYVKNRKQNVKTMRWHGPYDQKEAERVAKIFSGQHRKSWRNAECCMTKS
ncbi:MAG TPA: hypothetical protein ENH13_07185 [Euryarchaeota archaeon]|nr:hypothetical protein [Euryarchaeota archaeon]